MNNAKTLSSSRYAFRCRLSLRMHHKHFPWNRLLIFSWRNFRLKPQYMRFTWCRHAASKGVMQRISCYEQKQYKCCWFLCISLSKLFGRALAKRDKKKSRKGAHLCVQYAIRQRDSLMLAQVNKYLLIIKNQDVLVVQNMGIYWQRLLTKIQRFKDW